MLSLFAELVPPLDHPELLGEFGDTLDDIHRAQTYSRTVSILECKSMLDAWEALQMNMHL